jgi:hypothetical protein
VSSQIRRYLSTALIALLAILGIWHPVTAEGPDYALPATFALPWACGETRRLTWDPFGHWEHGKARGLAFDFSMESGTPIYAPLSGQAHFLRDERPFDTNYGHYIEIIDPSGWWMVRLAHLRDAQSGERWVEWGELIAYSGSSGATSAHLHVELLVRRGDAWVAPDWRALDRLFGVDTAHLIRPPEDGPVDGPIRVTGGICAPWEMVGPVAIHPPQLRVGERVEIVVPLRNKRPEPAPVGDMQLLLLTPDGEEHLLVVEDVLIDEVGELRVDYWPEQAGRWCALEVLYEDGEQIARLTLDGEPAACIEVLPSPLRVVGIGPADAIWRVHEPLRVQVEVLNEDDEDVDVLWENLYIEGRDPHGLSWSASVSGVEGGLDPLANVLLTMQAARRPTRTGVWTIDRLGLMAGDQRIPLQQVEETITVVGPELQVRNLRTFAAPGRFVVFMDLVNVGTEAVAADVVEIWGWEPDGERSFAAAIETVPALAPGQAAYLRFEVYIEGRQGVWELVEGGYWADGVYIALRLPEHEGISLGILGLARQRRPWGD